jgi:large subunit ribosomal protein L24
MGLRIKKEDDVVVIAGKDKGARGKVLKVVGLFDRVIVEGVNRVKRHQKPTQAHPQGGIIEKEMPIDISNVMLLDTKADAPTRTKIGKDKNGKKVRVSVKTGTVFDG